MSFILEGVILRGINDKFIEDLQHGELAFFLEQVKTKRDLLSLEIRGGYINIYYRGGNLLKITQKKKGYSFHFDKKYCLNKNDDSAYEKLKALNSSSAEEYAAAFKLMMCEMDSWLDVHPKKEREYQHKLLSRNPSIMDIEYQINYKSADGQTKAMRLDMIMVVDDRMIIVENKYGKDAVSGNAGLSKHYKDICVVLYNDALHEDILSSIKNIVSAKYQLGLVNKPVVDLKKEKTEVLFLLAAYNPKSKTFNSEISAMDASIPARVLFTEAAEYVIDYTKTRDLFDYGS